MKFKIWLSSVLIFVNLGATTVWAQERSSFPNLRRNAATIIFCGLGGAVLGLSTLSFYGKPQEHLGNIYVGLGVGLIAGSGYVYYRSLPRVEDNEVLLRLNLPKLPPPQIAYSWEF